MRFFVTGTAGFIGFHLARRLLDEGHEVVGFDGFTPYYDVRLKERRSALLRERNGYVEHRAMLEDAAGLGAAVAEGPIDVVIHLAAQAGVRYSLENPRAYIDANIVGTFNLIQALERRPVRHLLIASTSSVYGGNPDMPFRETDRAVSPLTLYAASKGASELMAHCYSHLWGLPTTAFRFFTVYGPWGRPDMALFKFTKGIVDGTPIEIFNHGDMQRDFTYIDDLIEAIWRLVPMAPRRGQPCGPGDTLSPVAPYRVVNIGAARPVMLPELVDEIERCLGRKAIRNYVGMQPGDVSATHASSALLDALTGYRPATPLAAGVRSFVDWYRDYHCDAAGV